MIVDKSEKNFSIIIPIYNKEKYLERCLNSILVDDTDDYEIIAINDESTDNCANILKKYNCNSKIRIYTQNNIGVNNVRLKGINLAIGKYIIFVDADDTICIDLLNKLRTYIKSSLDIIKYNVNEVDSFKNKKRYKIYEETILSGKETLSIWNKNVNIRYGLFAMYCFKREFLKTHLDCFVNYSYYEDVACITKLLYFANQISVINYDGYNYYRNPESKTNQNISEKYECFCQVVKDIKKFYRKYEGKNSLLYSVINRYYNYHLKRKKKELVN